MRRLASLMLLGILALVLSGCAMHRDGMQNEAKVKCPACGYEFNVPSEA